MLFDMNVNLCVSYLHKLLFAVCFASLALSLEYESPVGAEATLTRQRDGHTEAAPGVQVKHVSSRSQVQSQEYQPEGHVVKFVVKS